MSRFCAGSSKSTPVKSMRSLGGIILMAGIGVALFVYLPAPVGSSSSFDRLQRVAASRSPMPSSAKPVSASRLSSFSPSITLPTRISPALASLETTAASAATSPPAQASAAHDASSWQTTVVSAATPAPTELTPRDPDARYKLVLDIQQQLRRAGCYWGRIDGSWGYATKDAMKEFTNRVNATLPLDQPDYVQLALIQSHGDHACGACPTGQILSHSGRCVELPVRGQIAALTHNVVAPLDSNMEPSPPERQSLFRPVPTIVISTEPLPGRMSIGALDSATVDPEKTVLPLAPGAATPSGTAPNVAAAKPAAIVSPTPAHRTRAEYRQGFATDGHRESPGTPRYNLLLGLGGLY
jgi:peptidoglycan hydrolase-like protein with peptidoglycan-binding domain